MPATPDQPHFADDGDLDRTVLDAAAAQPGIPHQRMPETGGTDAARAVVFSKISGQPTPADLPGRLNVGRLLRRCAGVHEDLLAWAKVDRARYTGMGGFVLFTAMMAVGSSTLALMIAFDQPWYVVAAPALFWGVLIFNLDRWIVSSPLPEHGLRRVATIAPRLLMALVFGVVIAEPVVLKVFETAVTEQLTKIRVDAAEARRSLLEQCNPASDAAPVPAERQADCKDVTIPQSNAVETAENTRDAAQQAVTASAAALTKANEDVEAARGQMNNECRGLDGSPHGNGDVCKLLTGVFNETTANRDRLAAEDANLRKALDTANQAVAGKQAEADRQRTEEINRRLADWSADENKKGGLLERIEALNSVAAEHFSLLIATWAIRLLLILIDCAPAIAKFTGSTTYDRLVRAEARLGEQKHKARSMVEEDQAMNWADESEEHAEIGRAERRNERDRAADALLLSAALHREQQAPQFRPIAGDDHLPFGRATYTLASRVESAGAAYRPPVADFGAQAPPAGPDGGDDSEGGPDRRDRGGQAGRLAHAWGPMPSFSVVALGGPGSGKTTFLAQMYDRLRRTHDGQPFRLTLSDGGPRTHLENWADTIRRPGSEWPDSTTGAHLTRYEFTCSVAEGEVHRPVLRIGYWDYSGEALLQNTELPDIDELRHDLSEKVAAADALLIIVDGEQLRRAADGDEHAKDLLTRTLTKIEVWAEPT
ncbi:DUF4407 domain-containing protein, partial [Dactylosporangium sp. NPDC005572]|uniref:DUF4407 domain-containing protein n=1 Tax=Dactylosporangium sp. NPDC005572 TaxID=3156889 RepID=UPI0033AF3B19